ncbi:MAG TPA: sigma-70 family RNA polymerase sigma factor, partial [Gemmata sp.]|nr:sigma-70 family RNA polymerase sigma factor [Gemmata sp.]
MKYPRPSFARRLRHLAGPSADQSDSHLLEAVAVDRDPKAFRALVARHGPGVLAVCRRVLRNHHDAEDAFQATFLVLLRRAGQVGRPDRLPQWLNGVAAKVALKARERAARRAAREALTAGQAPPPPDRPVTLADLAAVIDHEVARLPAKYREPFVLCHLAGRGQDEAAADLRVSRRTLQRRLDQARELLRERLSRRGVTLSAAVAAAAVAPGGASAVPRPLEADTVRLLAAPPEAARLLELAGGALRATAPARWQALAAAVLVACAAGVGLATGLGPAARPPAPQAAPPAADAPEADELPDHAVLRLGSARWRQGVWVGGGAAYSPDGKRIALQPQDGPVELCDTATGKVRAKLSNAAALGLLQFAPDGKRLLGVDFNTDDVQVWDHAAGLR